MNTNHFSERRLGLSSSFLILAAHDNVEFFAVWVVMETTDTLWSGLLSLIARATALRDYRATA